MRPTVVKSRQRKYVWHYAANWDRHSWNGISYTGNETHVPKIRMHFLQDPFKFKTRKPLRTAENWIRLVLKRYRGRKRRRTLFAFRKATKARH